MQDDLLMQLMSASSDEEKAYLLAMALIETQPPEIREAIIAAAVPHWFDAEILAALLTPDPASSQSGVKPPAYTPPPFQGEGSSRSDDGIQTGVSTPGTPTPGTKQTPSPSGRVGVGFSDIYCAIRNLNLPFVQPFGELGLTLHDLTRAGIRAHLFTHEPERFKAYSRRAAAYFLNIPLLGGDGGGSHETPLPGGVGGGLRAQDDPQRRVEGIYHQLVENDWESRTAFWKQMETYCMKHGSLNLSAANMLLANLIELTTAGIVGGNRIERLLSSGYTMLGDLQQNRGSISAAEDSYRKSLAIDERLAQADPANAQAQQDLAVSYERIGDMHRQFGQIDLASEAYQKCQTICQKLIETDASDVWTQRELSISYNKLGDLAVQRGDLNAAQQMFQQILEICERLAQADPANAEAQRDLSVSYNKLGDLAVQRGDLNGAQQMFQRYFEMCESLAQADPANANGQSDLSVSYNKLGRIEELLGNTTAAIHLQEQAYSILQPLFAQDSQNVWVKNAITEYQGVLERLRGDEAFARSEYQAALMAYQRAFGLSKQVAEEQLDNLDAVRDTYWNSYKIGTAFATLGQTEQARDAFRNALALAEPFAAQPENALAQRDVAAIRGELQKYA